MSTVLFLQNSFFESLGIEYLSAVLKKDGFSCELFIYNDNIQDLRDYIRKRPDIFLLAFQIFSYHHDWAVYVIKELKSEFSVPVVIGGGHPTFFPEESIKMEGVDFLIRAEGEYPLLHLCRKLIAGKRDYEIKSLWAKKEDGSISRNKMDSLIENLDKLPYADRTIYESTIFFKSFPVKRFLTRRGCPYSCSFCFNKQYRKLFSEKGKYVRIRTPDNVIEEILEVRNRYRMKTVAFTDDDFTSNKKWCYEFLEKYKKLVNVPFTAFGKASELNDELVMALKDAGCHMFAIGIESGNEQIRNKILRKNLTDDQIFRAANFLHKHGVNFMTFSMLGNPEEDFADAEHTLRFNVSLKPRVGVATVLNPYIETDIHRYCLEKGLIDKSTKVQLQQKADIFGYTIFIKQPHMDKIVNLSKVYTMLVRFPFLIPIVIWLIRHKLLPRFILKICYAIFSAFRQKMKLNLNLFEFIFLGLKVWKQSY